jgi:ABC-2 type transport system permease protein
VSGAERGPVTGPPDAAASTAPPAPSPGSNPTSEDRWPARPRPGAAAFTAIYRLVLRHQVTPARLLLLGAMGALAVVVAVALVTRATDPVEAATEFINEFGLGLAVPVGSLMLASAALGDPVEDETLVYLWLRPTPRWLLATAAWAATLTVTLPLTVVPLTIAAAVGSDLDAGVITGALAATTLGVLAYTGLFTLVGLVFKRSLVWGLVYVFIWEFFVARGGSGAARLSINSYPASVLAHLSGVELRLADRAPVLGVVVPVLVAVVALALTTWRLERAEVA